MTWWLACLLPTFQARGLIPASAMYVMGYHVFAMPWGIPPGTPVSSPGAKTCVVS